MTGHGRSNGHAAESDFWFRRMRGTEGGVRAPTTQEIERVGADRAAVCAAPCRRRNAGLAGRRHRTASRPPDQLSIPMGRTPSRLRSGNADNRAARVTEDRRLLERYHRDGDPSARDALAERFLPLARHLARRYQHRDEPLDDLMQVASLGLLNAIDRFDPSRATAFSSFAVPTILGELRRHFRDRGWSVRVPRDLQELALRVERVGDDLACALGRAPTLTELAAECGATTEQVLQAREAAGAHHAVSLDGLRDDGDRDDRLDETIGAEDPGYGTAEQAATLDRLMSSLSHRERDILRLRFEQDLTQSEIGSLVGVSQMQVSRLMRQAITHLRDAAEADAWAA
jgi:RNA polymerase sigma-B factor